MASGSDFPVELPNPMLGFYAAITRRDPSGRPATGWMPVERMSRDEALASFTRNAAFAAHAETLIGSLESGSSRTLSSSRKTSCALPRRRSSRPGSA